MLNYFYGRTSLILTDRLIEIEDEEDFEDIESLIN